MPADPDHPTARAIRAARAYANMSRAQVGKAIGRSGFSMGDWERGEWKQPPPDPMLAGIVKATKLPARLAAELFRLDEDATRRYEDAELPAPPGELGRDAEGSQPTDQDLRRGRRQAGEGSA